MPNRYEQIRRGELDVGKLFVDTKRIYLAARQDAAELDEPRLRSDAMDTIVEMMGRFLRQIQTLRFQIVKAEVGLKGFDADFAGLQKRYTNLYKPFFEGMPHPSEWTAEQWASFEEDVEGPILLWDLQTCRERWGIPFGTPPCEGPDLQMTFSLLHQLGVAEEVEQELIASIYGLADISMSEIGEYWSEKGKKAAKAVAGAFRNIAQEVKNYFPYPSTGRHIAMGAGIALAVGGGGYLWLKTRKGRT